MLSGDFLASYRPPLLLFHMGANENAIRSPKVIKRDFRALGRLEKGSVAQVVFLSSLPVVRNNTETNRQTQLINAWLLRDGVLMRVFMLHYDVLSTPEHI